MRQKPFNLIMVITGSLVLIFSLVMAGSLTPPGPPGSTMKTIDEVYNALGGTFDSSGFLADEDGNLIENLKYISNNLFWASSGNDIYNLNSGNVGIGTATPSAKLDVAGSGIIGSGSSLATLILNKSGTATVGEPGKSSSKLVLRGSGYSVAGFQTETVDDTAGVGYYSSLQLDSSGYPVISYGDEDTGYLKLAHCNDANCADGDESIETVDDKWGISINSSSLQLDSSGYPVISYHDYNNGTLKLVHCNDANCSGGDESIETVDDTAWVGEYASLEIDSSGYPVISYFDEDNGTLKLTHCNDANCADGDESIETVDDTAWVGLYTSLEIDSSGYPVISYYDDDNGTLKLVHCNDANCSGGDESIETVDDTAWVGEYASLEIDSSGYPVISYFDEDNGTLKLTHCNDANCADGDESIETVDDTAWVGLYTSLEIDSSGYPVISYHDGDNGTLKLVHCNDANCSGGDELIETVDNMSGDSGSTSLKLDASGSEVISYLSDTYTLKLAKKLPPGGGLDISFQNIVTDAADYRLAVKNNNNVELLTITSSGNVGIGITAPGRKLDINGDLSVNGQLVSNQEGGLYFGRSRISENQLVLNSDSFGATWTERTGAGARNWMSVSLSSDGKYQTAGVYNGYIYTSSDYGVTWTERTGAGEGYWYSVSLSSDGKYQTAVDRTSGYIYTSSDYGATWTERTEAGARSWMSVSLSSDGKYQTAVTYGTDYIYTSSDYGATWTERTEAGERYWTSVSLSSDGKYQTAGANNSYIYTSSDYGATWTVRISAGERSWRSVSLSSDGKYQTAVVGHTIYNGYIYTSSDYGATWTERTEAGERYWYSVSLSSDGKYQGAGVYNGYIYTSSDYGATWTERTGAGARSWRSVSLSSDGKYQTAGVFGGYIYTSVTDSYVFGGNVGIGTASPNERLTIGGVLSLEEVSEPTESAGYGKLYVNSSDGDLYYLDGSGNSYNLNKVKQLIKDFVDAAGEDITAGDVVSFLDGEVQKGFSGTDLDISYGSEYVYNSASTSDVSAAVLSSSKFVVAYRDIGNSSYGTAVIGDISGVTITYGSEYVFNSAATGGVSVAALSSSKFAVAYSDTGLAGRAVIGDVSGTVITYGSEYAFNPASTTGVSAAALSSSKFAVAYADAGNSYYGTAVIGDVSGNVITFGSEYVFNPASIEAFGPGLSAAALSSSKFVATYRDGGNGSQGTAIIGDVSGTVITYGSEYVFNSAITYRASAVTLSSSRFTVTYQDGGNSYYGTAIIGDVSGNVITFGSEYVFNSARVESVSAAAFSSSKFTVAYADSGGYDAAIIGDVSGTTITYGSEYVFNNSTTTPFATVFSSSKFTVAYADPDNSDYGTARIGDIVGEEINLIGIAKNSATTGQTVSVIMEGISDVHAGLTTDQAYYAESDGSLTDTPNSYRVGLAVSSTEILLNNSLFSPLDFYGDLTVTGNAYFSGNLGIGTTTPSEKLTVVGGSILQTPGTPVSVNGLDWGDATDVYDVYVSGRYAYTLDSDGGFTILDVSNPSSPSDVGVDYLATPCYGVYVSGRYAYIVCDDTGDTGNEFHIYDISTPAAPFEVGGVDLGVSATDVYVSGRYAYITTDVISPGNEFQIYDVSDPSLPSLVGGADLADTFTYGIYVSGIYAYVVKETNAGTCEDTTLDGCEFSVFDVSDPSSPFPVGGADLADEDAYDVYISGRYAYLVKAGDSGTCSGTTLDGCEFSIYDIADPYYPSAVGGADLGDNWGAGIYVSGRYAYLGKADSIGDCEGTTLDGCEFSVFDVSDPSSPSPVGGADLTNDVNSVYVSGRYAYVVTNLADPGNEFQIYDVTGIEVASGIVHSLEAGNLQVRNGIILQGQLQITGGGGINVGEGGIFSSGPLSVYNQAYFSGNVGIGTTTPIAKLTVSGDIVSGNILPASAPTIAEVSRTTTQITEGGNTGSYASIAIGDDGLPVISHHNGAYYKLMITKCGDIACSSGNTTTQIYDADDVGLFTSVAIGTDGLPIISYYNATDADLMITKCGDTACSAGNTTTQITDADNVGHYTSIAIGTDGLPVISHGNESDGDLMITKCGDVACSAGNTTTQITDADDVGEDTSIAIGTDGLPIISYYNATDADLMITKCGDVACSSGNTTTQITDADEVGESTSIAIGTDGLPVISYENNTDGDLMITKCGDVACSAGNTTTQIADADEVGLFTSVAIGTDGLPVISYENNTDGDLMITRCGDIACSSGNITTQIYDADDVGYDTSIAIGTDGLPVISYLNTDSQHLTVTKCADSSCAEEEGTALTGGSQLGGWMANPRSYSVPFRTINTLQIANPTTFQNLSILTAGAERITITPAGNVGIGTTTPQSKLQVEGYIQLDDGNTAAPADADCDAAAEEGRLYYDATNDNLYVCSGASGWRKITTGAPDIAENYSTFDSTLEVGDVLAVDPENPAYVIKSTKPYQSDLIGIFSWNRSALGPDEENSVQVALIGRVEVKVSTENGEIKIGDALTSSSEPGIAMAACAEASASQENICKAGRVIGVALEPYSGEEDGKILVFVNPHWIGNDLTITEDGSGEIVSSSAEELRTGLALLGLMVSEEGVLEVQTLKTKEVCIGQTCITEEELKQLLEKTGVAPFNEPEPAPPSEPPAIETPPDETPPAENPPAEPESQESGGEEGGE